MSTAALGDDPRDPERSILVTNDDGVESPALLPLAAALDDLGDVSVVVPDDERSWSGKAMTRVDHVTTERVDRDGRGLVTTTGSPADATQIGCGLLAPGPDLVVSGINLGHNHGSAFVLSSGTIGAAAEAVLLGRTAVALSTGTMDDDFAGWRRRIVEPEARDDWVRLAEQSRRLVESVLASGLVADCDLVSINLPWGTDDATPWRVTTLAPTRYGPMMVPATEGRWAASYGGLEVLGDGGSEVLGDGGPEVLGDGGSEVLGDGGPEVLEALPGDGPRWPITDIAAAEAGMVSITPINLPTTATIDEPVRTRLERG